MAAFSSLMRRTEKPQLVLNERQSLRLWLLPSPGLTRLVMEFFLSSRSDPHQLFFFLPVCFGLCWESFGLGGGQESWDGASAAGLRLRVGSALFLLKIRIQLQMWRYWAEQRPLEADLTRRGSLDRRCVSETRFYRRVPSA